MAILRNIYDLKEQHLYQVEIEHAGERFRRCFSYTNYGKLAALENAIRWRNKIKITLGIK